MIWGTICGKNAVNLAIFAGNCRKISKNVPKSSKNAGFLDIFVDGKALKISQISEKCDNFMTICGILGPKIPRNLAIGGIFSAVGSPNPARRAA